MFWELVRVLRDIWELFRNLFGIVFCTCSELPWNWFGTVWELVCNGDVQVMVKWQHSVVVVLACRTVGRRKAAAAVAVAAAAVAATMSWRKCGIIVLPGRGFHQ